MQERQEFFGRYTEETLEEGDYGLGPLRFKNLKSAIKFAEKKQSFKDKLEAFISISGALAKKKDYESALKVVREHISTHVNRKKAVILIQKELEKKIRRVGRFFEVVGDDKYNMPDIVSEYTETLLCLSEEKIFEYMERKRGIYYGEEFISLVTTELVKRGKFELAMGLVKSIDFCFYSERAKSCIAIELAKKSKFTQALELIEDIKGVNYFHALYGIAIERADGDVDEALKMIRVSKAKKEAKVDDIFLKEEDNVVSLPVGKFKQEILGGESVGYVEDVCEKVGDLMSSNVNIDKKKGTNVLNFSRKKLTPENIKCILDHNFLFGRALAKLGICYSGRNIMINCPRVTLSNAENILMNAVTVLDTYDVNLPFEIMGKVREMSDEANDILLDYAVGVFGINYADRWHWIIENSLEVTLDNADNIIDAGEILTDEFLQKNGIRFSSHIKEKIKNMLYKANTIVLKDDESLVGDSRLLDQAMNTLGIDFDSENYFNLPEVTESNADNIRKAILVFEDRGYLEKNDILLPSVIVQKIEEMRRKVDKMFLKKGLN